MRLLFLVGLGALAATPLAAQPLPPPSALHCDASAAKAGAIRGRVVADSTGQPVPSRAVGLNGFSCTEVTDSTGAFLIRGVPPGGHLVRVAPLGFRPHPGVPAVVQAGDTTDVGAIRLRPENQVADCLEEPGCAALLRPDPAATRGLTDGERLLEAVLRTSLALAGRATAPEQAVPCAPDDEPRVFAALAARLPGLVPASACALPGEEPEQLRGRLTHTPTGRSAFGVSVDNMEQHGDTATARSHGVGVPADPGGGRLDPTLVQHDLDFVSRHTTRSLRSEPEADIFRASGRGEDGLTRRDRVATRPIPLWSLHPCPLPAPPRYACTARSSSRAWGTASSRASSSC
jgi:hypothetical protein